jgi:hypothetical protein
MSHRIWLLVLFALTLACGAWFLYVYESTLPLKALATGTGYGDYPINWRGWLQLAVSALGTSGLSLATLLTILRGGAGFIPTGNPIKNWLSTGIDVGQIALYRQAYDAAKTPEERNAIRAAAALADKSLFSELFPDPAGVQKSQ